MKEKEPTLSPSLDQPPAQPWLVLLNTGRHSSAPCSRPLTSPGGFIQVKNVSLPKATFVKFRPQSVDFLEITNQRAVLERALRSFSCVTVGDQICIPYNDKFYYLEVRASPCCV